MALHGRVGRGRTTVETSMGQVELPIRYWDVSAGTAFFRADRRAAARMIEPMGLVPLAFRSSAIAALAFFEYRGTSIGPYNEVALAVLCRPADDERLPVALRMLLPSRRRLFGFAVLDLPVTTSIADVGGRELWGYPKFVTELPIKFEQRSFDGEVLDPGGQLICSLRGRLGRGLRVRQPDLVTYTLHHGRRWRTEITTSGSTLLHRGGGLALTLGTSDHEMRGRLAALGLDGASPLAILVSGHFRSLLHQGSAV